MPGSSKRDQIESLLPIIGLIGIVVLTVSILLPFAPAILWGIILSVAFGPAHRRLTRRLGDRRSLSAALIGVLLVVTLVLPMIFLSRSIIAFIPDAIAWFSESGLSEELAKEGISLERYIDGGSATSLWRTLVADFQAITSHYGEELRPVAFWLIDEGRLLGLFVIEFALGVMLAIILLNQSDQIGRMVGVGSQRLGGELARELVADTTIAIRSSVFGVLGSAAAQTAVASIAYVIVGVPHWPVLALLTFVLGLIQIGPILIWLPICFWLWTNEQIGLAMFMGVWGLFAVGLTDNLVKALVVSRGAGVPAILAFLGALGGLLTWGIVGLFVGPVIVAVAYRILRQWLADNAVGDATAETEPASET